MDARDRLLTTEEAAAILRMSKAWLEQNRFKGGNQAIPFLKIGKSARYRLTDIEAFIDGLEVRSSTPGMKRGKREPVAA